MRLRALFGSRMAKAVLTLSTGAAASQVISFVVYPLLTRLYSPEAFGLFASFSSVVSAVASVAALQYQLALPLPRSNQRAFDILVLAMFVNVFSVILLSGALCFVPASLGAFGISREHLSALRFLLPLGVLASATYSVLSMWAVREREYRVMSTTRVAQSAVTAALKLGGGITAPTGLALVVSGLLGSGVGIGSITRRTLTGRGFRIPSFSTLLKTARRYWRFSVLGAPAELLNTVSASAPVLLVGALYSLSDTGQFSLVLSVVGVPIALFRSSLEKVFFGEAGKLGVNRASEIQNLMGRFAKRAFVLTLPVGAALAIGGPWLFGVVFGSGWVLAGEFSRFFSIFLVANLVSTPFESIFPLFERQGLALLLSATKAAIAVASFWFPYAMGLSVAVAVGSYATSMAMFYVVLGTVARATVANVVKRMGL